MKRKIVLSLDGAEREALATLSQRERRDMRDQAALIIRRELERAGLLPADVPQAETPGQMISGFGQPGDFGFGRKAGADHGNG